MPTVIDSFVVEFQLDPAKFTKGQREVLENMRKTQDQALRGANEVESNVKKTFDLISNMKREALTALGIFFGGRELGEFVKHITSLDAATGRLATTLGMSVEETSAWQGAIKQAGGSAEGANAALSGLSGEMARFQLTGQSAMLPVLSRLGISLYDQNRNLKTAGQLWLELSQAVQGMNAREATAFLQMIPGATQDMINFALLGPEAMGKYIAAAKAAGTTTAESAAQARDYQRALEQLDQSSSNLGRTLVTGLAPALVWTMDLMSRFLQGPKKPESAVEKQEADAAALAATGEIGVFSGTTPPDQMTTAKAMLAKKLRDYRYNVGEPASSSGDVEAYIRQAATARGVNPDIAVQVYRSEGARNYVGDQGSSFGPYQLHYGGMAGGGNAVGGLGDTFTKETGLNARDPSTWKAQVDFSLDKAKTGGWGPWHGWKGAPFAGIDPSGGGGAGGGKSVTVNVGGVTVNTSSGNGDGIANDIEGSLRRSVTAGAANYGPQ